MPSFDEIIQQLRGETIAEKVTNPLRMLRQEFQLEQNTCRTYDELVNVLLDFERLYFRRILHTENVPRDYLWLNVSNHLGRGGRLDHLMPRATRGLDGGLDGIIHDLVEAHERQAIDGWVNHVLGKVNPFDIDTISEFVRRMRTEYGGAVDEMMSPALMMMNWRQLIQQVAQVVTNANRSFGK